ncbi:hypothetical protein C8J57DRAFT_1239222 [Mycena rebaudengoi]|nr:hypothetical protein C8J57DRAFT_1239222 [Mycena rebaudengoi]
MVPIVDAEAGGGGGPGGGGGRCAGALNWGRGGPVLSSAKAGPGGLSVREVHNIHLGFHRLRLGLFSVLEVDVFQPGIFMLALLFFMFPFASFFGAELFGVGGGVDHGFWGCLPDRQVVLQADQQQRSGGEAKWVAQQRGQIRRILSPSE